MLAPRAAAALRPAGRARGARARRSRRCRGSTCATLPDLHDRPADRARLRRRDLRRAARRRRRARVGAHRRRRGPRAAGLARRPRGVPARDLGLRAGAGGADAARGALQPGVLAGARTRTGWRSPWRWTSRARSVRRSAFHRSIIRSDQRLTYPEVDDDLRGRGARRGAAGRRPAGGRRAGRRARGRARGRELGARVRLLARGPRDAPGGERADRVAPPDRAPDDRRQRGGGHAARDAQAAGAVPRARAAGAGARGAAGRAARVAGRPDAAAPAGDDAAAGRRRGGRDLAPGGRGGRAAAATGAPPSPRWCCAR